MLSLRRYYFKITVLGFIVSANFGCASLTWKEVHHDNIGSCEVAGDSYRADEHVEYYGSPQSIDFAWDNDRPLAWVNISQKANISYRVSTPIDVYRVKEKLEYFEDAGLPTHFVGAVMGLGLLHATDIAEAAEFDNKLELARRQVLAGTIGKMMVAEDIVAFNRKRATVYRDDVIDRRIDKSGKFEDSELVARTSGVKLVLPESGIAIAYRNDLSDDGKKMGGFLIANSLDDLQQLVPGEAVLQLADKDGRWVSVGKFDLSGGWINDQITNAIDFSDQ